MRIYKQESKDFLRWFFKEHDEYIMGKIMLSPFALIYALCIYFFGPQDLDEEI